MIILLFFFFSSKNFRHHRPWVRMHSFGILGCVWPLSCAILLTYGTVVCWRTCFTFHFKIKSNWAKSITSKKCSFRLFWTHLNSFLFVVWCPKVPKSMIHHWSLAFLLWNIQLLVRVTTEKSCPFCIHLCPNLKSGNLAT